MHMLQKHHKTANIPSVSAISMLLGNYTFKAFSYIRKSVNTGANDYIDANVLHTEALVDVNEIILQLCQKMVLLYARKNKNLHVSRELQRLQLNTQQTMHTESISLSDLTANSQMLK